VSANVSALALEEHSNEKVFTMRELTDAQKKRINDEHRISVVQLDDGQLLSMKRSICFKN
jgi:hypothetical protein